MANEDNILVVNSLKKYYPIRSGINPFRIRKFVRAVDNVSIKVPSGKTIAVVGESGCGKTTLARTIALLTEPTSGEIVFENQNITTEKVDRKKLYSHMQMVFQDADSSLDPRLKVKDSVAEPLRSLMGGNRGEVNTWVTESLLAVGLSSEQAERVPSQLSGGQKQRMSL